MSYEIDYTTELDQSIVFASDASARGFTPVQPEVTKIWWAGGPLPAALETNSF